MGKLWPPAWPAVLDSGPPVWSQPGEQTKDRIKMVENIKSPESNKTNKEIKKIHLISASSGEVKTCNSFSLDALAEMRHLGSCEHLPEDLLMLHVID